jgi:hypothetical protein
VSCPRKERSITCTYHCSGCGRHFHSLAAFDLHRVGDFASNDPETRRRCEAPIDLVDEHGEMRLTSLTERGLCRSCEAAEAPVTVWTMKGARERARQAWGEAA